MDTLKKYDLMQKIVHELDDLHNTQQALIQKIGKIEVDNFDLADKKLEKDLPDIHQRIADNLDTISGIIAYFNDKADSFRDKNNIDALREKQAIDEASK